MSYFPSSILVFTVFGVLVCCILILFFFLQCPKKKWNKKNLSAYRENHDHENHRGINKKKYVKMKFVISSYLRFSCCLFVYGLLFSTKTENV